ncbi:MAG: 2-C-methyl-D-erythritol 2,4-cyclodiphosphate synthase [Gammaproteobacteria bacterium]|nr:2-C-methyl-D-erythritol 2,4-cyclodiphosphate synthase [Gammaproteobacteria bacterium]
MRIGHGYDAHRFKEGKGIVLGGVDIPFNKSFEAHSDGDVLLHALCDAMLGAAALGDIGKHFPDASDEYKGISSRLLLQKVHALISKKHFTVGNVDITVVAEAPKLAPFIDNMRQHISEDLEVPINCVSVKATTTEGMGFVGRGEGVEVHAVVLLKESSD